MRTRAQSRAAEETRAQARPGAPVCVELHDVLTHIFSHVGDHHRGSTLNYAVRGRLPGLACLL